jgi:DNA polymerase I
VKSKEEFIIDDDIAYNDFIDYLEQNKPDKTIKGSTVYLEDFNVEFLPKYLVKFEKLLDKEFSNSESLYANDLIYGKDKTEGIVSIEAFGDDQLELFFYDGTSKKIPARYWICASRQLDRGFQKLQGNSTFDWVRIFRSKAEFENAKYSYGNKQTYVIWNDIESQMVSKGITLFKGLKVEDVSVLSFDIEASGLVRDDTSEVYVITNTFKHNNKTEVVQFRVDEYESQKEMIDDWCDWVRKKDPAIINGHNIFGYDFDYLHHVAEINGTKLFLGKDGSEISYKTDRWGKKKLNKKRVDGSQTWDFVNYRIHGRHIIDGMFLAVMYDIGRNYPSWGLKAIAEYEGIVKPDRQFYDASKIAQNWSDPVEREKIVKYCEDDGNDSMALYELMIPSFFYMAQSIPKPFQDIVNGASGSWLNSIMVRSYLQDKKSIPKASEPQGVSGGISFGIAGVHDNVFKIDIKSMYPSIMRQYQVNDPQKDPENNFFKMVDHFTIKRFEQKGMYKKTGDKYYDDMQAASKIFINSCYGMLGTPGLNFNSFPNADFITGMGRQIIRETMKWATGFDINYWWNDVAIEKDLSNRLKPYDEEKDYIYDGRLKVGNYNFKEYTMVNADTDSISFRKPDGSEFSKEEMEEIIEEVNSILPEMIEYEDDGYFDRVIIVKAKNYVLKSGDKIKYKGSSLTDPKKEPALIEMLHTIIEESLIKEDLDYVEIYNKYIKEVNNIKEISRWATKKSITENLLKSDRKNETKVVDALKSTEYSIGDKRYLFNDIDGMVQKYEKGEPKFLKDGSPKMIENKILKLVENFDGSYDKFHYAKRVYDTVKILQNVIDMERVLNYNLKRNQSLMEDL